MPRKKMDKLSVKAKVESKKSSRKKGKKNIGTSRADLRARFLGEDITVDPEVIEKLGIRLFLGQQRRAIFLKVLQAIDDLLLHISDYIFRYAWTALLWAAIIIVRNDRGLPIQ